MIRNFKNKAIHQSCTDIVRWKKIFKESSPKSSQYTFALKNLIQAQRTLNVELDEGLDDVGGNELT